MSTAAAAFSTLILATEPTMPVTIADVVTDHSPDAATMTGLDPAGEVAAEIAAGNAPGAFVAGVTIGCNCIPLITGKAIPKC